MAVLAASISTSSGWATAGHGRIALVIGNANYRHTDKLKNPRQDAAAVAALLRRLDFNVLTAIDLDRQGTERILRNFSASISEADVALFYYSGHAVQVNERNYLVPVTAELNGTDLTTLDAVALQDVNAAMQAAGARVRLLILDACRNNPFAGSFEKENRYLGAKRGLAAVSSPVGTLIAFSTAPGSDAYDGDGEFSPFTESFVKFASTPSLEIRQVLSKVRADVVERSQQRQIPWDTSSLVGDFFLVPRHPPPVVEKNVVVRVAPARETLLHLRLPAQVDGGTLVFSVDTPPTAGSLFAGKHQIAVGEALSPDQVEQLRYAPRGGDGTLDFFDFRIADGWGNELTGHVLLQSSAQGDVAARAEPPPAKKKMPVGTLATTTTSTLGVGPNLVFPPITIPGAVAETAVRLVSDVPYGQFLLNDRVIEKGRQIKLGDVPRLTYVPFAGTSGRKFAVSFAPKDGTGEFRLTVGIVANECDRLAGAVFDPQGVADGVLGGRIDLARALPACQKAVSDYPASSRFIFQLARVRQGAGDSAAAAEGYRRAADMGHVRARVFLASLRTAGYGVPKDLTAAKRDLDVALHENDIAAMFLLGKMYLDGRSVPKDVAKGTALLDQSARGGYAPAMTELGVDHIVGKGMEKNPPTGRRYWEEAARRGDVYASQNLGLLYLTGNTVPKDYVRAMKYLREAADLGHPEAPNNIALLYFNGLGVPANKTEAKRWYRIGSDRGDAWASYNLGRLAESAGGVSNIVEAAMFYSRAASFTQPVPSERALKALMSVDRRLKLLALGKMLRDLAPKLALPSSEREIVDAAGKLVSLPSGIDEDKRLETVMIASARALWLRLNVRTDLF